jgi:hypothetical protein
MAAATGASVPGYEIIHELGRGGMGVVYQARQLKLNRPVALKMILAGSHAGAADLARFGTETEAIARLQHPNIVQVYEVGEHEGKPYFSMEFCGGGSLEKKINGTPLPAGEAAGLVEALARAMQAAHEQHVIHRDLKPANVLLAEDGAPKITDFGLAKKLDEASQTATGAVMGTPSYMAPEQAGGMSGAIGPPCDIYALGAILYECLTGRPPFKAATPLDTILQVISDEPVPPTQLQSKTPRDLETICLKCLQKEPHRRYESAAALADDLRQFREGRPIAARPVGRLERAVKWVRRNPVVAGMAALVALSLLVGTGVSLGFAVYAQRKAELATKNEADAIARGKDLAVVNETLARTANDLETTLARSLLRPLGSRDWYDPITGPEWEAMWQLATNRRGRLGYRFVEEALASRVTIRQLRLRAALALPVAVGLDDERRAEVEALLVARMDDPGVGDDFRLDLAWAAAEWGGLSRAAAARTARPLVRAMAGGKERNEARPLAHGLAAAATRMEARDAAAVLAEAMKRADDADLKQLAPALAAVAARLGPGDAAQAARDLARVMADSTHPATLSSLAQALAAVAARAEAADSADAAARAAARLGQVMKGTQDTEALDWLTDGLAAVAACLDAKDAARTADGLIRMMKDVPGFVSDRAWARDRSGNVGRSEANSATQTAVTLSALAPRLDARAAARAAGALAEMMPGARDPKHAAALSSLAQGVAALAARMEPAEAAAATERSAAALVQAMKDARGDTIALAWLTDGLCSVAARLEPGGAARVALALAQAMKETQDSYVVYALGRGLPAVAARLGRDDAGRVAATLLQGMKGATDENLLWLAQDVAALTDRLEAPDAAAVSAQVAAALVPALKEGKQPSATPLLAESLAAAAAHMDRRSAAVVSAAVAGALLRRLRTPEESFYLPQLAEGLAAAAVRMDAGDAAAVSAAAARTLLEGMNDTTDGSALHDLAEGLAAVVARMDAKDATTAATQALARLVKVMKSTNDAGAICGLARGVSALVPRVGAEDAAAVTALAALTLLRAVESTEHRQELDSLAEYLSSLLAASPAAASRLRSATAAAALALPAGSGHPLTPLALLIPAAEPAPGCLSTQQLVELLKMPTCVATFRHVILDQLGNRYKRHFADVWEFARFAKEQDLALDFTTPPARPKSAPAG